MASTFMGLEIAKRGLAAHQTALQTTGHNISNADNKNYARQRVELGAMQPIYEPTVNRAGVPGQLGQGVVIDRIARVRDEFIDGRIHEAEQNSAYWNTREKFLHHLEIVYNEPSDESLRSQMDRFWQSWQELSQFPEEMAHREVVRTRANDLTFRFRETFNRMFDLRMQVDTEIESSVAEINDLAFQVRDLNERILKSRALGDNPNDLMDRRDALVQKMSSLADISVSNRDPDELIVYIGGQMIVQGEVQYKISLTGDAANEGFRKLTWEHNGSDVVLRNGKLHGLLEVRDRDLKENIEKLDLLATNIAATVNEVHRDGFGLTKETNINFFSIPDLPRNSRGNFDLNGDGTDEITAVFRIAGRNKVTADKPLGFGGTLTLSRNDAAHTPVYINYRPDQTLQDIVREINRSGAGLVAYLNHKNNLVLKGTIASDDWRTNHMIRHIEDSGELLVGYAGMLSASGPGGSFDYRRVDEVRRLQSDSDRIDFAPQMHAAASIRLDDSVQNNIALIAAASGKDSLGRGDADIAYGNKDGSNALMIAQALKHKETMVGDFRNPDEFYNATISRLGTEARTAKDQSENQELVMKNLENLRQSVMGVNLDEEMANMVQFQHGYNAAARVIQTMNEMIDQIIRLI